MILKILAFIIGAAVLTATYFYVPAQINGPTKKSLIIKMSCATGYVLIAVLCIIMTKEVSEFDKAMLLAFGLSWIGDLFLHLKGNKIFPVIGYAGFLASHICFIRAYLIGIKQFSPDSSFFSVPLIITLIILMAVFIITIVNTDMPMLKGPLAVPVCLYAAALILMFCKATKMGWVAYQSGINFFVLIEACLGALLFVSSDFSISILIFNKKYKQNSKLKYFNMYTYFSAQLLLAGLTYFI